MKTDLDYVIEAISLTLEDTYTFTGPYDMLSMLFNNLREAKEARDAIIVSDSVAGWEEQSPLPESTPIPEEWKLPTRGIDETDAEVRERVKANINDADYWDVLCPKGHFIRCASEDQKNLWCEIKYPIEGCKECFKLYSWVECTFKTHQMGDKPYDWDSHPACESRGDESKPAESTTQECVHDVGWVGSKYWKCKKCHKEWIIERGEGNTLKSYENPAQKYHSGKDALDKLMRGECDYIVFDDPVWIKDFVNLHLTDDNFLFSVKNTTGIALRPEYYLQTKWLCLKDEK